MTKNYQKITISLLFGLFLSFIFFWMSDAPFIDVFPGSFILTSVGTYLLALTIDKTEKSKIFRWIIVISFLIRLIFGILVSTSLPVIGYDEPTQNSGYLFKDAFNRDTQAWDIAKSDKPFFDILEEEFIYDQYGGLLVISTVVYKVFSPNFHNKLLIIFLAALISSIGISFIWKILSSNRQIQLFGTLIYAFYPDAILFSSSQMREPFLLGLSAILFWLVMSQETHWKKKIIPGLIISGLILSISAKIGIFILAFALICLYLNQFSEFSRKIFNKKIFVLVFVFLIGLGILNLRWILDAGKWDAILALSSSGWIQQIFSQIPEFLHLPFITIYGLLQPVLPAAIVEPSIPIWKFIGIIRSLGWFVVSPLFLYSFVFILRNKENSRRKERIIFFCLIAFWILLSSLRAGGDMWDNPRYRLSLLVPISIFLGTSTSFAIQTKDHWFSRIFAGQFVLNIFFLQWYISRYTNIWGKLDFPVMIGLILLINALILGQGIYWEIRKNRKL